MGCPRMDQLHIQSGSTVIGFTDTLYIVYMWCLMLAIMWVVFFLKLTYIDYVTQVTILKNMYPSRVVLKTNNSHGIIKYSMKHDRLYMHYRPHKVILALWRCMTTIMNDSSLVVALFSTLYGMLVMAHAELACRLTVTCIVSVSVNRSGTSLLQDMSTVYARHLN